jgi:hypothetical protein
MLPSVLKLCYKIAINGIFPIPPGSIIRRFSSNVTKTTESFPDESYLPSRAEQGIISAWDNAGLTFTSKLVSSRNGVCRALAPRPVALPL